MNRATAYHRFCNTSALTAADVRFALALAGREASAVRVRAVTNKLAEVGFDGALRWAFNRTSEQLGRDIRDLHAGLYMDPADLRRIIEATRDSKFPEVAFDYADRIATHDRAAAQLAAMQTAVAA